MVHVQTAVNVSVREKGNLTRILGLLSRVRCPEVAGTHFA